MNVTLFYQRGERDKRSVDLNEVYSMIGQCRLPKEIRPSSYRLELQPFIKEGKFKGRVKINITWVDTTDRITLNVHPDLQISHSDVRVTQLGPFKTLVVRRRGRGFSIPSVILFQGSIPNVTNEHGERREDRTSCQKTLVHYTPRTNAQTRKQLRSRHNFFR